MVAARGRFSRLDKFRPVRLPPAAPRFDPDSCPCLQSTSRIPDTPRRGAGVSRAAVTSDHGARDPRCPRRHQPRSPCEGCSAA